MELIQFNLHNKQAWICRNEPTLTVTLRSEYNASCFPKKGLNIGGTTFRHSNNAYIFVDNYWDFEEYNCLHCIYARSKRMGHGSYLFPGSCKLGIRARTDTRIKYVCKAISHYSIHELIHLTGFKKGKYHSKNEEWKTLKATDVLDPINCDKFIDRKSVEDPFPVGVGEAG
jgi:hypothetical protein